MGIVQAVIGQARSMRTEHQIKPGDRVDVRLRTALPERRTLLERERVAIEVLARTSEGFPRFLTPSAAASGDGGMLVAGIEDDTRFQSRDYVEDVEILLPIDDIAKEQERLERVIKSDEKDVVALEKKLGLPSFKDKAPREVVVETEQELGLKQRRLASNRSALELLKKTTP
jgi:valyl-tRNA synthetase